MKNSLDKAIELDKSDELSHFKDQFVNDDRLIYMDGNSLGKLPKRSIDVISNVVEEQWGNRLIRSWNEDWMELSGKIAKKISMIVGAGEDEILVGDSTSMNLFKLAYAAVNSKSDRNKIISDDLNFPSDLYVLQGLIDQHFKGHKIELLKSSDGVTINEDQLAEIIDEQTALVSLSHVTYKSSFMYNMEKVNKIAHKNNSYILWDLSHSAGAVNIDLNRSNADMAVGCTYKYLNGGPGAPAFLYVKKDLQQKLGNPITSWFSHERPFEFDPLYQASSTIQKFAIGTPTILSLAAIEPGLDITLEAGMPAIRAKSIKQTDYLAELIEEELLHLGFRLASPLDSSIRGSHISIQHKEAYRINRAMIEPADNSKVIIPDFRPPNNIRLGITPLYTSYCDIYYTIQKISHIIKNKEYENFSVERTGVT